MKKLLLIFLLTAAPAYGSVDSLTLRPTGDQGVGDWVADSLPNLSLCSSTNLWFRIKEAGSGNNDTNFVELDENAVGGCNVGTSGSLMMVDVTDYSTSTDRAPDSMAIYVKIATKLAATAADSLVVYYNFAGVGDYRLGKPAITSTYTLFRVSTTTFNDVGPNANTMDSLRCGFRGYFAALKMIKCTQLYAVVYFTPEITGPAQPPPTACEFILQPTDTADTAMNWTFDPAITNRVDAWKYVDDSLVCAAARFPAAESSITLTGAAWRSIHFGLRNPPSGCDGKQIDAISIRVCVRAADGPDGGGAVGPCSLRVGIKVNPLDSLPMHRYILNAVTVVERFTTYVGQINSSIRGDRWTKDSLTNMIVTIQGYCVDTLSVGSIYLKVHHSTIDANVPDSTDEDIERKITGDWTNEVSIRSGSAFWQSQDTLTANAYQKLWAFTNDNTAVRTYGARASTDSGATWTAFAGPIGGEDSLQVAGRNPAQPAVTTSLGGPCIFNQWRNRNDDTLFLITGTNNSAPATASHLIYGGRPPVLDTTDFTEGGFWGAGTSRLWDTLSAGTAVTLRNNIRLSGYALDDTFWVTGVLVANNNAGATNVNGGLRSTNKGETWASGLTNAVDSIGGNAITAGPTLLESAIVPWRTFGNSTVGAYPAVFLQDVISPNVCGEVKFYQWNPQAASLDTVWGTTGNTSNIGVTSVAAFTSGCTALTGCNTGHASDLRATVVWRDSTNMTAHCMWVAGGKLFHGMVTYNGSTIVSDTNVIWEEENCENSQFDIASWDTVVYAFWRHNDSLSPSQTAIRAGTSKFWFSIWDGSRWRAPRPVTMSKTLASSRRNLIRVSVPTIINKKSDYIPVLMAGRDATDGTVPNALYFSKILKRAAAAAPAPDNRRRRILLMGKKTEEEDEEAPVIDRLFNRDSR